MTYQTLAGPPFLSCTIPWTKPATIPKIRVRTKALARVNNKSPLGPKCVKGIKIDCSIEV